MIRIIGRSPIAIAELDQRLNAARIEERRRLFDQRDERAGRLILIGALTFTLLAWIGAIYLFSFLLG